MKPSLAATAIPGQLPIGTVKTAIGNVRAVNEQGLERSLLAGAMVYANEQIITGANGGIIIEFIDGSRLDLPREASLILDTEIFNPESAAEAADQVTRIQQLIAAGMDPAAAAEAAAAGTGATDEGGASFVVVDFENSRGHVTSGFPTTGIPTPEFPLLESQIVVEGAVPLTPPAPPPAVPQSPPDAINDQFVIHENQTLQMQPIDLLGNDSDPDGNPISIISVGNVSDGTLTLNANGTMTFVPDQNFDGQVTFDYTISDGQGGTDTATVTITVLPQALPPDVALGIAGQGEASGFLSEDVPGQLVFSAAPQAGSDDTISRIEISGFPDGWTVDAGSVTINGATHAATYIDGRLTLQIEGLNGTITGTVNVTADTDSDVDRLLTITAQAVDGLASASASTDATAIVDAVADWPTLTLSIADSADANTSFQSGESGSVTVNAMFRDYADGSETHTVTVAIPDGYTVSGVVNGSYTPGLSGTGGSVSWTVTGPSLSTWFTLTHVDAATGNVLLPGTATALESLHSGAELIPGDNLAQATDTASLTTALTPQPTVTLTAADVGGDTVWIKEDSNATLQIQAEASPGSTLTELVITGLQTAGWSYDFSSLGSYSFINGTLTLSGLGGTHFIGSFGVTPAADSDLDLGTLSAQVSAASTADPGVTGSGSDTLVVNVDAVADMPNALEASLSMNGYAYSVGREQGGDSTLYRIDLDTGDAVKLGSVVINGKTPMSPAWLTTRKAVPYGDLSLSPAGSRGWCN